MLVVPRDALLEFSGALLHCELPVGQPLRTVQGMTLRLIVWPEGRTFDIIEWLDGNRVWAFDLADGSAELIDFQGLFQ